MNGSTGRDDSPAIGAYRLACEVEAQRLLDDVCLEAGRGSLIGLIGPNGAGKTTLLRALSGILRATQGAVRLDGAELASLSPREVAASVALVPQIAPYTHGFTAMELVMMGRYPHLGRFRVEGREDGRITDEAMRLTDTRRFADRTLDTLSGGERQRVFVARALSQQPSVLLLDEPTSNLDVLHQLQAMELVRSLVDGGLTAIAAIHDLNLAARFCDRLVMMKSGRVIAEGTPEEALSPESLECAFGVRAVVYRDPATGAPAVSVKGPAGEPAAEPQRDARKPATQGGDA